MRQKLSAIWSVLYNWRELWFFPLIAYANVQLLIFFAYFITGRWPQESADSLVGLGINLLVVMLAISATSILRESTGKWWTTDQMLANPNVLWSATIAKVVTFVAIVWALKH